MRHSDARPPPVLPSHTPRYQQYLVTHHCVHHHIEYGGGWKVPLYHPPKSLEIRLLVSTRARHHFQPVPIGVGDVKIPRYQSVTLQDIQESIPFFGVIGLVLVKKYHIQDLLPHGHLLLNNFGLKGGGAATHL